MIALHRHTVSGVVLTVALLTLARPASAQFGGSGSIQGTVVDASKSALPGATVTATNLATEVVTTRQTTEAGVYVLSPLPPGEYRVTVTLMGFETAVREGIVVDALTTVGLNVTLTVAGVKQDVVVTAEAPQLATADARLGQTIRNEVYTALPLVMNTGGPRDPTAFMFLMPGVQSVGRWGNVMGGQDFTNDTYIDGIPITNAVVQGEGRNLSFGISVESIEQFQVETSGTAVMYNGQGASNYVVKSGTNQFRGSVFEYFRNKALDSKAFFAAAKPDDNQHEFGFTAGGPIRRSRMFFFSAYDGYRDRRQTEQRLVSVPTLAQRRGDFSALPVTIYDPRTTRPNPAGTGSIRDPFPGNVIPPERLSPISRYFQSFLPDPTNGDLQNNYLGGNLPIGFDNDNVTVKVDLTMTSRQQASLMVAHGRRAQSTAYRGGGNAQTALPLPYTETRLVEEVPTTAQLKHTYVLGARWVNQASFGFSRLSVPIFNATIDGRYPIEAGLTGLPPGEADSSFPEVSFAGPNVPTQWRGTDARAFTEYLNNYTLQNNLNWTHGKHAMTFGFQGQRMDANERERAYGSVATFGFSNAQTAGFGPTGTLQTATGHAYASFLLGDLNATNVTEDSEVATSGRFYTYGFWVQDDYRVTPDLTLNLGLRYDIMKPYTEVYDRWSFMNPDLPNPAVGGYPGAIQFAGTGENSCNCRTPIADLPRSRRSPHRVRLQRERAPRAPRRLWHQLLAPRRGRRPGGRAQRHRDARVLRQSLVPEPEHLRPRVQLEQRGPGLSRPAVLRSVAQRRLRGRARERRRGHLRRPGDWRAPAALSELERGRSVRAGRETHRVGDIRRQRGRLPWRQRPRLLCQSARPEIPGPRQPAHPACECGQHRGGAGHRAGRRNALPELLRHDCADAAAVPQYSGVTDVYGNVASSRYHSMQLTAEKRRGDDGLTVNVNYTFSRTEDNLAARTGWDFAQDWAVGVNDQPHIFNAMVVYDLPFGAEGRAGSGNSVIRAIVRGWQVSGITQFRSGRPLGSIAAACNLPSAGNCYADFNPDFSGPVRINGDYGDGDVLGSAPPSYIDRAAFVSPPPFTYGNTPRTLAHDLRNPNYFNQDLSIRRDFLIRRVKLVAGLDVFNVFNTVVFGGINTNITSAAFGRVSSQANTPRVAQLKARLEF